MRRTQWDNIFRRPLGAMRFYHRQVPLGSSTVRQVKCLFRSVFSPVKWAESRLPALGLLEESGKALCGAVERVRMASPHGVFL